MARNQRSIKTEADILDQAWELIVKNGADVSVEKIGKAAGVSRQAVYVRFGNRQGLLTALVRRADERYHIREQLDEVMAIADPRERFEGALKVWLSFVPHILPVARSLIRLRGNDADASAAWNDRMGELRQWILQLMKSLKKDGVLSEEWSAPKAADYFWTASSVQAWDLLVSDCGWSEDLTRQYLISGLRQVLLTPLSD